MRLEIKNLSFQSIIGIYKLEREVPQRVVVDAIIDYTYKDGVFIDYAELAVYIRHIFDEKKFLLLEDAILHLKESINAKYQDVEEIYISITKPDVMKNCTVTVSG